jgi:hypothetical protein
MVGTVGIDVVITLPGSLFRTWMNVERVGVNMLLPCEDLAEGRGGSQGNEDGVVPAEAAFQHDRVPMQSAEVGEELPVMT